MMLPTHLVATILLGLVLARVWPGWDARSWMLAIAFGVAIDIDHFAQVPGYLATQLPAQGLAALSPAALKAYGGGWSAFFHQPIGAAVVFAVAVALHDAVPVLAWSLHRGLDTLVGRGIVEFAGPVELLLLAVLAGLVAVLGRQHVAARWPHLTPSAWAQMAVRAQLVQLRRNAAPVDREP